MSHFSSLNLNSLVLIALVSDIFDCETKPLSTKVFLELEDRLKYTKYPQLASLLYADKAKLQKELAMETRHFMQIEQRLSHMNDVLASLARLEVAGVHVMTHYDDAYPNYLSKRMKDHMPLVLYYKGQLSLLGDATLSYTCEDDSFTKEKQLINKILKEHYQFVLYQDPIPESILNAKNSRIILCTTSDIQHIQLPTPNHLILSMVAPNTKKQAMDDLNNASFALALSDINVILPARHYETSLWYAAMRHLKVRWSHFLTLQEDGANNKLVDAGAIPVTLETLLSKKTFEAMMAISKDEFNFDDVDQLSIFDFL